MINYILNNCEINTFHNLPNHIIYLDTSNHHIILDFDYFIDNSMKEKIFKI